MLRFIGKRLIKVRVGGSILQSRHTEFLFLVAINGIGELENGVDGSLLANDLAIYITTRNQRVAIRAL